MYGARRALHDPFFCDGLAESIASIGSSDTLKSAASFAGPISSVAGGIMQFAGARNAGRSVRAGGEFEAAQLDQNAGQQQASAQRKAREERRRAGLVASRAQALAAMGGGGSDPTVIDIISDIAAEGAYRSALALFEGDDNARALRMKAAGTRYTAGENERAYKTAGTSALFKGFGTAGTSLFSKYAKVAPIPTSSVIMDAGIEPFMPYA